MANVMSKIVHRANSRGKADHGWLHSRHTFSFAGYHNPDRMGFGKLRVLNDDVVKKARGFDVHPHDNMEIISIPLAGSLEHRDSMGNIHAIQKGDIQIMSAGTGITHSEYNHSATDKVNFLQIWVLPKERDITPSYDQKHFDASLRKNNLQLVISPDNCDGSIIINQDAFFTLLDLSEDGSVEYKLHTPGHGVYVFVIDGAIEIEQERLQQRDAMGISGVESFVIKGYESSECLFIEVPMTNGG